MKIPAIKKLVETSDIESLNKAEENLLEGLPLGIEVDGEDEGEQLTHILAAREVLETMQRHGVNFRDALRTYTERVRKSIG